MSTSVAAMPSSTKAMTSSNSGYNNPTFWEQLWRTSGLQFVGFFVITSLIYGYQPQVGASADALTAFYNDDRTRILIAAAFSGLNILNLLWFAAALRTALAPSPVDCRREPGPLVANPRDSHRLVRVHSIAVRATTEKERGQWQASTTTGLRIRALLFRPIERRQHHEQKLLTASLGRGPF